MGPHEVAVVAGLEPAACALTVRHARPVRLTTIVWYPTAVSRRAMLLCRSCCRLAGRAKLERTRVIETQLSSLATRHPTLGRPQAPAQLRPPRGHPNLVMGTLPAACLEPLDSTCTVHLPLTRRAHRCQCFKGMLAEGCAHDAHAPEGTSRLAGGPAPRAVSLPSSGTQTWSRTRTERLSAACSAT